MTGRRSMRILCTVLLMSLGGPGGWSMVVPALAQGTGDAAPMVVYQEPSGDVADVSVFYEPLAPYGTWTSLPEYGQVWMPHDISPGWRPYTYGRWVYTSYGWTWVAEQEWGWAPFHYGRWAFVASHGWVWLPGTVWAPAWVVWRHTPGWVGWAPLPPQVVVRPGIEITAANLHVRLEPSWFCFVEERRLLAPRVSTYIAPPARNVTLVQMTQNVTHYTMVQNRVVNRGIPVERIETVIARPVPRMRVVEAQAPEARHRTKVREREREVVFFRPATPPVARAQAPHRTPSPEFVPGPALPQQPQDARRQQGERQGGAQTTLEERQRSTLPPRLQGLSPEELRVQRGAERRALEDKAPRDQQESEQQRARQQLQQRQEHERQRALQQQEHERQRSFQQQRLQGQQQPGYEHQHIRQQQQPQVQQPQVIERQRAFQQPQRQHHQPSLSHDVPPQTFQQPRAATQRAPEESKEPRKRPPQPPPGPASSQR